MTSQSDLFGGKTARDAALAQVAANAGPWRTRAILSVHALPLDWVGIGEDVRLHVVRQIGNPHDQHAWGELIKACVASGMLVPTGEVRHMRVRKSHARQSPVYRRWGRA
jgi:hypothetical protein